MKLIRTFHPVGHGAFYTERFYDDSQNVVNVVFDCGCYEGPDSCKSKQYYEKQINDIVDTVFPLSNDKTKIDALFISHFHADHINGIPRLLKNCDVKRVIMPKLIDDVYLEVLLYSVFVHGIDVLIANDTLENFVKSINDLKVEVDIDKDAVVENADFNEVEINDVIVRSVISVPSIICVQNMWRYIPFTTVDKTNQLIKSLKNDVPELNPALSPLAIDFKEIAFQLSKHPQVLNKCKDVYNRIFGDKQHNRYSMTLFSGTCCAETKCFQYCHQNIEDLPLYCTKNCLYMGDFEADPKKSRKNTNCDQLLSYYSKYWNKIGLFQVPHHGSHDNINEALYFPAKVAIISAGKSDVYHHPNDEVIALLHQFNCIPVIVNENPSSIQRFVYIIK